MDMLDSAKARVYGWGDLSDFSKNLGLKIKIPNPKEEAAAAAALAEEIRKEQLSNDKAFRDRALEASRAGLTGLAKDMADVNAEIGKRNVMVDKAGVSHYVPLTKAAWKSIIEELQYKLAAFKHKLAKDNREHLADYLKAEEEAAHKRMEYETRIWSTSVPCTKFRRSAPATSGISNSGTSMEWTPRLCSRKSGWRAGNRRSRSNTWKRSTRSRCAFSISKPRGWSWRKRRT
jgi:hypothetical protein